VSSGDAAPGGEEARPSVRGLCPHCGAVCEPHQEYCLACGLRLHETETVVGSLAERWRSALPFAGNDWAWPVLIALAISILASAFAIIATRDNETRTFQAIGPTVHPTTAGAETLTTQTTTGGTKSTTTTKTKTNTAPIRSNGLIAWPGPVAYTIVLASIPVSSGKSGARQKALEAVNAGLEDVGVLKSSDFSSLHPGYYVVFSGVFANQDAAFKRLPAARRAGFDSPYAKRVAS
jgi:hypothetical protein